MSYRLLPFRTENYHGKPHSRPYFEGWYFRQRLHDGSFSFSVIPGIYRGRDPQEDHCFIQVISGPEAKSRYIIYPIEAFRFRERPFLLRIGESAFSPNGIDLRIDTEELRLWGGLQYRGLTPPQKSFLTPSVMGPFAFLPGMQCNHGILSLYHRVDGQITLNGQEILFEDGYGYIEKDWGREFPSGWLWLTANQPDIKGQPTAFSCSVATIPYRFFSFTGLIAVYLKEGKEYRFTTYGGGKAESLVFTEDSFSLELRNRNYLLKVTGYPNLNATLMAPDQSGMKRHILEDTDDRLELRLFRNSRKEREPVAMDCFDHAAVEMAEVDRLNIKRGRQSEPDEWDMLFER